MANTFRLIFNAITVAGVYINDSSYSPNCPVDTDVSLEQIIMSILISILPHLLPIFILLRIYTV